jgi:hypothetical protein
MNFEIGFHFICGAMVGIEFVSDEDASGCVVDLGILRVVFTRWRSV